MFDADKPHPLATPIPIATPSTTRRRHGTRELLATLGAQGLGTPFRVHRDAAGAQDDRGDEHRRHDEGGDPRDQQPATPRDHRSEKALTRLRPIAGVRPAILAPRRARRAIIVDRYHRLDNAQQVRPLSVTVPVGPVTPSRARSEPAPVAGS